MSSYTIEKVLWDLVQKPHTGPAFRADPDPHLDRYPLELSERTLLKSMDVRKLAARRINPMLLMRAWQAVFGKDQFAQYLKKIGGDRAGAHDNQGDKQ
jgi:hypothetical protein